MNEEVATAAEVPEEVQVLERLEADLAAERAALDAYMRQAELAADFSAFSQTEDKCPRCEVAVKWRVLREWFLNEQLDALRKQAAIRHIADVTRQEEWIRLSERAAVFGAMANEPQRFGSAERAQAIKSEGIKKSTRVNQLWAAVLELRNALMGSKPASPEG